MQAKLSLFNEMLHDAHITQAELARELGKTPATVSRWKDDTPKFVVAYLKLKAENIRLRRELEKCQSTQDGITSA